MKNTQSKSLKKAAAIVMTSIVFSRITGFIREAMVPNMLAREQSDAFNLAFKLTGLMYDMLVGGAIAAALIPVLSGYIANNREEDGWKAAGTFINIVAAAGFILSFLGMSFTRPIITVMAGVFGGHITEDTITAARILFPSVAFLMLAGLANGVLNSYRRFAAAAYGPTIYNLGCALSLLFLSRYGIQAVAYGVMCSAAVYFVFQLSFSLKDLKYYKLKLYLKHPGVPQLFRLAIPSLLASSIVQINVIISFMFTTTFPRGYVTAFNIADRTWQLPYGIFAQGIGIAMLPSLSSELALGEIDRYKEILHKCLKTVLFLSIPSGMGFIVLKEPIIRTMFQFTSKFESDYVVVAGSILALFSLALLSQSVVTVANRAYYASNDTKTPLLIGSLAILVNITLSAVLHRTRLGVSGIALAYSISSMLNAALLLLILNRKMKGIYLGRLFAYTAKTLTAACIMGVVLYLIHLFPANHGGKLVQLIHLLAEVAAGAGVYLLSALVFGLGEAKQMVELVGRRLKMLWKQLCMRV